MLTKLVLICTVSMVTKISLSQYYSNQYYQNMPQNYYPRRQPEPAEMDYEEPMDHEYRRHGLSNIYARSHSNSRIDKDDDEYESDSDFEDCKCSCSRCRTHPNKPCCTEVCQTCEDMRQSQQMDPNPPLQPAQGSVLFVPYPYPLMVPNNNVKNDVRTTTATTTTTTQTTTTTTEDPEAANKTPRELKKHDKELYQKKSSDESNIYKNQMMKNERRYMLTTVRKTKPAWEPKYGIVPIPDTLAEKLMNQLKQDHGRKM